MTFYAEAEFLSDRPDFKAMLFALCALLAVSLPLMLQLPVGVAAVFVLFWLLRLGLLALGIRALKTWQIMLLLGGVMLLVWQQLGTLFGLQGGIAFLLMLSLLKSYEGKSRRDWQVLVLAMLFLTAGALLFDQGLFTGLWTLPCLLLMALTLAVLNQVPLAQAVRQSTVGFLLSLPVMAVLFLTVPRREMPLWGVPQNTAAQAKTGLSDTMRPGSIGDLVQSNEPAFSAIFDKGFMPQPAQLYWRVMIMAEHRDGAWRMMRGYTDTAAPAQGQTVSYQILAEDQHGSIPALDYPAAVKQSGIFREAGAVLRTRSREGVRRLRLQADLSGELAQTLGAEESHYYTALPARLNPRTHALARQLRQQSGSSEELVAAAYAYFQKQGFAYTLKPPVSQSANATDDFLFVHKQGFCEHYADAFAVLMRAAGLPARVVAGYQGGEYNAEGGFWQIRSKNAHAWTEVWLPEKRVWRRVDPTAAVSARIDAGLDDALPESDIQAIANRADWHRWLDRSRFYWQQWIVNYDGSRQQSLLANIGLGGLGLWGLPVLLAAGLAAAVWPVYAWWRRGRRQNLRPLADGLTLLKQSLLPEHAGAAALGTEELWRELGGKPPAGLRELLDEYVRLTYARADAAPPQAARAWYRRVRRWVRQQRL